jgi:hypothetical protein
MKIIDKSKKKNGLAKADLNVLRRYSVGILATVGILQKKLEGGKPMLVKQFFWPLVKNILLKSAKR